MRPSGDLIDLLVAAGVTVGPGLTAAELAGVERRFAFRFAAEHRDLLAAGLPVGVGWPDWRHGSNTDLLERLNGPGDGLLFDVRVNGVWPASWGQRPQGPQAIEVARQHIDRLPRLIPIYSHRYLPAGPAVSPAPVFSVHQSDVICYGADLDDYLNREFNRAAPPQPPTGCRHVPFWSDLAGDCEPTVR